jgi:hypothetical protein
MQEFPTPECEILPVSLTELVKNKVKLQMLLLLFLQYVCYNTCNTTEIESKGLQKTWNMAVVILLLFEQAYMVLLHHTVQLQ